jgi:hypothetical protein
MKIGKIVLQNGTEAEFGLDGWTSTDVAVAEYLNLMFGKETYLPQDGRYGVMILYDAAKKLMATMEEYPRKIDPPGNEAGRTLKSAPQTVGDDSDDDDDPWIEKTSEYLDSLEG